jgi:hypothetical protein
MSLNNTPISRNLHTSIRLLGLDIEDLMALGIISVFSLIIGGFVFPKNMRLVGLPMNYFCFLVVVGIGVPGLMMFKYGKPRGYLMDFISWHTKPHSYSASDRDTAITGPYILEDGDDYPKQTKGGKQRA